MNDSGGGVVAWGVIGNETDVVASLFDADGFLVGPEIGANTTQDGHQSEPKVAMNSTGEFIVVWKSEGQDGDGHGIYLQRFSPNGDAIGAEVLVNTHWLGHQTWQAIDVADDGSFVVVWTSDNQDGSSWGIYGQRFAADASKLGDEFRVNATTEDQQVYPDVAMNASGAFVVVWASNGSSGENVYGRLYEASGNAATGELRINETDATPDSDRHYPDAAIWDDGSFIVAWSSENQDVDSGGVYFRVFESSGQPRGGEIHEHDPGWGNQYGPQVEVGDSSSFTLTYAEYREETLKSYLRRFNAEGVPIADRDLVDWGSARHAARADGSVAVAVATDDEVFLRNFLGTGGPPCGQLPVNVRSVDSQDTPVLDMDATGAFSVGWVGSSSDGVQLYDSEGRAHGGNVGVRLSDLTRRADGTHVAVYSEGPVFEANVYAQVLTSEGTPSGAPFQVNTFASGWQHLPRVDSNSTGAFAVVWQSDDQNGATAAVVARFYAADGAPLTGEVVVNTTTSYDQEHPDVAFDDVGNLTVVWDAHLADGSDHGVCARWFDGSGSALTDEMVVNTGLVGYQGLARVATNATGDAVVVWQGATPGGDQSEVFARTYAAPGTPRGDEVQVNQNTEGSQQEADVAVDGTGEFAVAFTAPDQHEYGVFVRRFAADGTPMAEAIQVNKYTAGMQQHPAITMSPAGQLAVAWDSADCSDDGVYVVLFDSSGAPPVECEEHQW